MQEIYNRYFFFRAEEITQRNAEEATKNQENNLTAVAATAESKKPRHRISNSMGNIPSELFKSKGLGHSTNLQLSTEGSQSRMLDGIASERTLRGPSNYDNVNSFDTLESIVTSGAGRHS